jgi:membrane protease YdiL (CAAX protease family)
MAPAALVAAFVVALLGGLIISAIAAAFGADISDPPPAVNILATVVQDVAFVVSPLVFSRMAVGRIEAEWFGLRTTPLAPAVGATVVMLIVYFVLSGLWAALVHIRESDQLPTSLGVEESTVALVAVCVLVTVIAPVAEEFLFRGFFFGALRNWKGPWLAAALTGIVFGGIHAGSTNVEFLVPLALLGFLLCLLRWRTGSLLPCMGVHAFNNSIAFGANAAHWGAWQVILLIVGSNAVIMLGARPFVARSPRRAAPAGA